MAGSPAPERTPIVSRIPLLKPVADERCEAARPRPAGSKPPARSAAEAEGNPAVRRSDAGRAADEPHPQLGFVLDTRWGEGSGPTAESASPPAWLTQLTRWQWNSTLLAILTALLGGFLVTSWRSASSTNPAVPQPAPEIHYHLESPSQQAGISASSAVSTKSEVQNAVLPEPTSLDQKHAVALAARTEPSMPRSKTRQPTDSANEDGAFASQFEQMEYPETDYPDYSAAAGKKRVNVQLDGTIQQYK